MTEEINDQCQDPTQTLTIELPCQMAERDVAGVLIEALDNFLRKPK